MCFVQDKVQAYVRARDVSWFVDQTAKTWYAHLGSRVAVQRYDLRVVAFFDDLLMSTAQTEAGLVGVAWVYGTVLRREASPQIVASDLVWGALAASPSPPPSKFTSLEQPPPVVLDTDRVAPGAAAPALREYIFRALRKKVPTAAFRDVDCLQSDPVEMAAGALLPVPVAARRRSPRRRPLGRLQTIDGSWRSADDTGAASSDFRLQRRDPPPPKALCQPPPPPQESPGEGADGSGDAHPKQLLSAVGGRECAPGGGGGAGLDTCVVRPLHSMHLGRPPSQPHRGPQHM